MLRICVIPSQILKWRCPSLTIFLTFVSGYWCSSALQISHSEGQLRWCWRFCPWPEKQEQRQKWGPEGTAPLRTGGLCVQPGHDCTRAHGAELSSAKLSSTGSCYILHGIRSLAPPCRPQGVCLRTTGSWHAKRNEEKSRGVFGPWWVPKRRWCRRQGGERVCAVPGHPTEPETAGPKGAENARCL